MSVLQEEYKLAIDKKMLSPKVSEQDFENMLKDETKRKEYWDYCHQKNPSFYADDYKRFSQLTTEMLEESSRPTVAEHPAPTTAEEDSISLAKQNEGEQQYNIVTPMIGGQAQPTNNIAAEPIQEEKSWAAKANEALNRADEKLDDKNFLVRGLGEFGLGVADFIKSAGTSLVAGATDLIVQNAIDGLAMLSGNGVDEQGRPIESSSYDEQIAAAKRVYAARERGEKPDINDLIRSALVRGAKSVGEFAENMRELSRPYDVSENDSFASLLSQGRVGDALQLGLSGAGESATYSLAMRNPYTAAAAFGLNTVGEYADMSWDKPEMNKGRRFAHAVGRSAIEMLVEKFADEFKYLEGASSETIKRTFKEMYDGAAHSVLRKIGVETLKSAGKEGGEEMVTTIATDAYDTLVDIGSEDGVGLKHQYEAFKKQMREDNPDIKLSDKELGWAFAQHKGKEVLNSFFGGFFSGGITTGSTLVSHARDLSNQKTQDEMMRQAIDAVAQEDGVTAQSVYDAADREISDPNQGTAVRDKIQGKYKDIIANNLTRETTAQLQPIVNRQNNYIYQVDLDSEPLNEGDEAFIIDGNVVVNEDGGNVTLDHASSDETVYVRIKRADGTEQVKQMPIRELNLVQKPVMAQEWAQEFVTSTIAQMTAQQQVAQQAAQEQGQQVVGEDNGQPLGATEGEQASNIEGRQFTNGQQTITASNPDSNGNVTLSAPVTLPNGDVVTEMPQAAFEALMEVDGWQEVSSQPTAQGQVQGQQQAPISWSEMDANQATATVVERSKGDKERAKKFAQKQVEVKTKALQEAQAEMDAFEGDDLDAFNAAQDKVDAAQAEVDKWTAVANGIDAYNAPIQVAPQPTSSATSASGNVGVTEAAEDKKIIVNTAETALAELNKINANGKIAQKADKLRRRLAQVKASSTATADDARALLGEVQELIDSSENSEAVWTAFGNAQAAQDSQSARQSASNPQQSANNSQNTLQNENNSVPLQGEQSETQKVIDKIDSKHFPVVVFNKKNYREVMRKAGASEKLIKEVRDVLLDLKPHQVMGGFFDEGIIFIQEQTDLDAVRKAYVHERQHAFNASNEQLLLKMASTSYKSQFAAMIRAMAGNNFYDKYGMKYLVDEFICRAMEIAYSVDTDAELEAELRKIGANDKQIQIIKEINNEQRNDNSLSNARYNSLLNSNDSSRSEQVRRDSQSVSRGVLGQKGNRSSQISERRDRSGRPSEVTQDTALEESGIQVNDETGDARFSVNYRLDANQMDILAEQIAERVGVSKAKAKKWLKAETSLAALCMQEDNVDALYYFADGRYGAIKNNSDYPQGTVDFNNICRKRLDFTNIYLSMQREFPNKVFTAKDLETIRQIMIEDGLEVACGLCYVEDCRQLLGEIANEFRGFLKDRVIPEDLSATKKEVMQKVLDMVGDDTYIPTIAQLLEAGAYELRNSHPSIFEAFVVFNNSRGMQSGRLFEGYAEYKREILDWSDKKVKQVNDAGGLRIFSFSDFEAHHLIDIVQIISDAASKGVMIQGYTKVPEFARAIRNTKVKLNRSLIPLGDTGIQEVNGEKVLAYDTSEGIDVNSENFLDESNNPNVGNVLVGINDEQIRMAMEDANVDYIIPFHTGLKKDILLQKKIGAWVNYKNSQTEKDAKTGSSKTADGKKVVGINIYTDVLQAAEKDGTPINNRKEFVEYFLKVCKERGLVPRFEQFLARGKNGEYRYTKGYEKLLVDFKMFDKRGNILPQEPVVPIFDDAFNQQIIEDYVKGTKETKEYESTKEKIKENLQLNDYADDLAVSESQVRYSIVTDKKKIEELEASEKMKGYRTVILNEDGTFSSPMATGLGNKGKTSAKTSGFELGEWEQAEERPELADENGKINLKPKNGGDTYVDYNPYIHNRLDKINTQFTSAWRKPFLVYIETEIPMSDIESGYHAEKAALSVGVHPWNGGDLVLSRYDKPVRIVPWEEVADAWAEQFDEVTFDIVNPELLPLLHERGVKILPPKKAAKEKALAAYEQWKAENSKPRFSVTAEEDKAYADAVARGDMETAQRMVIEAAKKAMPNTKIVDADGNPMIVYHDTNATELVNIETGENWNDLDWRAKDEWRNREDFDEYWEERDFYTFNNKRSRRSIEMPAYFFSTKEDEYHEYGDRTIRAFLNITNPAMDPTIENAGTYDYAGEDAMNKLIEQGHDGFIRTMNNGEWDEVNAFFPNQIKSADPVTYDDNGNVIPLSERFNDDKKDIRFSLSNTNQRIFVSNAERAVESIKQEKATPQQWKAMIEKQGGLKAGEDKWLGLSEWLDSKAAPMQEGETMGDVARRVAKNTITKQEILDYIAEHQIQIEEVEYVEGSPFEGDLTMEQEGNFNGFILELEEIITSEGVSKEEAFETMVERYGDDFRMAFELDENGDLTYIVDYDGRLTDAAQHFLGKDNPNQINDVRLRYTTKGLENKQEIALTVPTVESWNEGDEIHFGDAGEGRAIAWVRFGETEMQTPREVIDHVDELQFAYTNANGQDVYAPQGSKFSKDYAVYGKLANGEMGYVLYVRNNQLSAHPTLEAALEALNAHYEANPRQVTDYGKVLVIDEIQSNRHQEGREKGYATIKDRDIKKKIAKLTDQQDAIFDAMRAREESRAGITNFTEEETAELKRLGEEIKQLQSELSADNGIIPDAPFDKNWHELAFKRMLRFAAENGYDYVAWTKGAQQAERYDIGESVSNIIKKDEYEFKVIYKNGKTITLEFDEDGVYRDEYDRELDGKSMSDIFGKETAKKLQELPIDADLYEEGLHIGGEGMKGFYDKMLPSFVSKYTKKWGAKVQDINLPNLEESAQTMHAVNVTQEMKDSVMDGQVMFSVRNRRENLRNWEESSIFAEQYRFGEKLLDSDYIDPFLYKGELDAFNEAQEVISKVTDNTPLNQVIDAYNAKAKVIEQFLDKVHSVTTPVHVVASIHTMMQDLRKAGISGQIAREIYNERIEERKYGIGALGFVYEGHVYIMAEHMPSLSKAQLVYGHELQHVENRKNEQLLIDVIRVAEPKELLGIAESLGGEGYADNLDDGAKGYITLADEAIAFAIEYGYMLGNNGNLAAALKRDGLKNEKLINLLQKEYERRKENTNLALNKIKRNESDLRSDGVGVQQDARTQEGKPRQVFEWKGFVDSSDPRSQLGKSEVEALRREAISELESRKDVPVLMLERVRFSITGAPVPAPDETKREYLKRYMEWRESQRDEQEVAAYEQLLKDMSSQSETLYRQWVDRNRPIEYFQEWLQSRGGKITSYTNAFADMTRSKGRVQTASGEFEVIFNGVEAAIKDIINSKRLKGIHLTWKVKGERNGKQLEPDELIGVYCQAMDVKEAKEKDLSDRGEAGFKKNLRDANGNEVSYEDVIRMVHSVLAGTNLKDNLWTAVNEATKFALKYQLAAGMIDQKTFDKFNRDYYVPERGWRERDMDGREYHYNEESGDLNGSPYNAALAKSHGRESLASDPFAYIKSIAISSIMSAEKNRTKQIFLQMLLENDEIGNKSGAWKIRRVYLVDDGAENAELSYIKPADESKLIKGFPTRDDVKSFEMKLNSDLSNKTKGEKKQHLVSVVRDGVPYLIELESELVARALNRDYPQRDNVNFADRLVRKITKDRLSMRSLTGFASSINTQHNPEFAPSNFIRDFFFANTKILMEHKDPWNALKKFNKNIAIMFPAVLRYVTTTSAGRRDVAFAESSRGKILKRFFEEGAQTGWSYLEEVNALREKIRKNLYKTKARKIATVPINVVLQMYSFLSEVSELSVRVAMFATEIELGKKPMDAAHNAKEITTNFDTKGEFANEFGVLWSFFNATIQGSNSLYRAVKKGKKRAFGVLGGVSAFMFALGYLITILQPDDPDEETMWNDYIRQTNIVIGKYKIPVMHFFRMFYAGGVNLALRHQGRKTKTESYYDAFQAAANEVIPDSPLRVQGLLVYDEKNDKFDWSLENYLIGLTPSIASPMVEAFVTNENFMGGKIDKEPYPNEEGIYKKRHYTKVQDNEDGTRHPYNLVADWISGNTSDNDLVGEDDWSPLVDISGSQLRHIVRGYTGGAGSFSEAAYEFGRKIAEGEELSRDDVPIIRKFTKGYNGESAYANEFYKLYYDIKDYEQQLKYLNGYDKKAYWEERGSEQYAAYMRLKRLVNRKPKEGDTHTPEDVRKLMEANKEWRSLK